MDKEREDKLKPLIGLNEKVYAAIGESDLIIEISKFANDPNPLIRKIVRETYQG